MKYNRQMMAIQLAQNPLLADIFKELRADCLAAFSTTPAEDLAGLQRRLLAVEELEQTVNNSIENYREAG